MKIIAVLTSCFLFTAASVMSCKSPEKKNHKGEMFVKAILFRTETGWGYEIYTDDSLYIRQPFIPSLPGKYSFTSREDALRTATFAIQKMANLHSMPRITQQDLQAMHIRIPN